MAKEKAIFFSANDGRQTFFLLLLLHTSSIEFACSDYISSWVLEGVYSHNGTQWIVSRWRRRHTVAVAAVCCCCVPIHSLLSIVLFVVGIQLCAILMQRESAEVGGPFTSQFPLCCFVAAVVIDVVPPSPSRSFRTASTPK